MLKNNVILPHPLMLMGHKIEDLLFEGGFGAVAGRAGMGKTALLVQFALYNLLKRKNVLHVSLNDPVNKVCLWYEEVFHDIANQYKVKQMNHLWETILPHRFIMTFKAEGFSVPKLEERLTDLTKQSIFSPQMILIDGLPFEKKVKKPLSELKAFAKNHSLYIWFTVCTQSKSDEDPGLATIPASLLPVRDLFEVIIELHPVKEGIHLKILKGGESGESQIKGHRSLLLDPSTMLIK